MLLRAINLPGLLRPHICRERVIRPPWIFPPCFDLFLGRVVPYWQKQISETRSQKNGDPETVCFSYITEQRK